MSTASSPGLSRQDILRLQFWSEYAPIPLRLVIGGSLVVSGYVKLFTEAGRANIEYLLGELGMPAPAVLKWVVGLVEFGGGVALVLGAFVAFFSVLNILNLLSLLILGWFEGGIPQPQPPLEGFPWAFPAVDVSWVGIAGLLALLLGGAGAWSIDRWRARQRASAGS